MFLITQNTSLEETVITSALDSVSELLPASWSLNYSATEFDQVTRLARTDGVVQLKSSTGDSARFVVEVKRSSALRQDRLLDQLRTLRLFSELPVLYLSDYVGPALRAALRASDFSYADSTGWVRMASDRPLVLLVGHGAGRSPAPSRPGPIERLNGIATNRIIRTLAMTSLPVGVRALAENAGTSPGSVSKLLATLTAEGIVDRNDRGQVDAVRSRALVWRWVRDYGFLKSNVAVKHYIAPRGLERTLDRAARIELDVALTGSAAAHRMLPPERTSVVPLRLLSLYASSPQAAAKQLGLTPTDSTISNVVIAAPQDRGILGPADGAIPLAPTALVLADVLTLPNRSDAEAEQLMDVLAQRNVSWLT